MKKTLLSLFFFSICALSFSQSNVYQQYLDRAKKYEKQKKWCLALDSYYDAMGTKGDYSDKKEACENYGKLRTAIENGQPGYGKFDLFSIHDNWKELLKETEQYASTFGIYKVTVDPLKRYKLDYATKTATYSFVVTFELSDRYHNVVEPIISGFRKAYNDDWKYDMPVFEQWPSLSVSYDNNEYNVNNALIFKYTHISSLDIASNAFAYSDSYGRTLFDYEFNIVDKKGNELIPAERFLLTKSSVSRESENNVYRTTFFVKNISQEVMNMIENNEAFVNPVACFLKYGKSDTTIYADNKRDFLKVLSEKELSMSRSVIICWNKKSDIKAERVADCKTEIMANLPYDNSKPLDLSVFTIQQRQQPYNNNRDYKWIKEKFNVSFNFDILEGNRDKKVDEIITTGDLPDLVEVDSDKFQNAGCLIDLKPLVEKYCPNIMKNYKNVWKSIIYTDSEKDDEGNIIKEHVYSLPNYGSYTGVDQYPTYNQNAFWIQKRVLKEFGYPEIKTVDQYFDLIEKYLKKHPTTSGSKTIGFNIITADWEAFNLWNPPNYLAGYPNDGIGYVAANKDGSYTYKDFFTDKNAKLWFSKANEYYHRGLIDPASFTDNRDQYYSKISQGLVLGMFIQGWEFMYEAEQTIKSYGGFDKTYVPLPIVFDESIKPHYRDQNFPNTQRGYGITTKCDKKKAIQILKFFDEILKEENQKRLYWGLEGEDYFIDKDGSVTGNKGAPYRTDTQRNNQNDHSWILRNKAQLFTEEAPKWEGTYTDGYSTSLDYLLWERTKELKPIDLEIFKAYNISSYAQMVDSNPPANAIWYPMWKYYPSSENTNTQEKEAYNAFRAFEPIQRKYLPQLILGNTADFEKTWNEYLKQMNPHTEKFNKFMQSQLDLILKNYESIK